MFWKIKKMLVSSTNIKKYRAKFLCSTVFLLQLKKTFAFRGGMYNDVQTINGWSNGRSQNFARCTCS
ncbi:hypothetical protein DVW23_06770 [Enterococcus faecium]|nr:hypothetical protein DVW23_06770 [Enterococcus faecium]